MRSLKSKIDSGSILISDESSGNAFLVNIEYISLESLYRM